MPRYDLNGKVALVTGAARGIGLETARQAHARGASVALVDLDAEAAREAAERVGPRAIGIGADASDAAAMRDVVAAVVERWGGLDLAVANAGIAPSRVATVRTMPGEEWERVVEVDLLAVWRTLRAALPQIVERRGQVVLIGSLYCFVAGMGNSPYAVAKSGVEALGRSLRLELAPHGASSTVAYFGWVDTDMVRDAFAQPEAARMEGLAPSWVMRRVSPERAAAGLLGAVERRAPRVFVPGWLRWLALLRGVLGPALDRRLERDRRVHELLRDVESRR